MTDSRQVPRQKLIEKAVSSIPTRKLKDLIPNPEAYQPDGSVSSEPGRSVDDLASAINRDTDPGRMVSCRLSFPDLIVERQRERAFLKELTDQLRVGLSGIGTEPLASTLLPRTNDQDVAIVQLSLPLLRADQLESLLMTPALLAYTPLLKFARFDRSFYQSVVGPTTVHIRDTLAYPAPDVLARLDEMEKRYLEIRDKRNLIESFHEVMKRTNPYQVRIQQLEAAETSPDLSIPGLDDPRNPPPEKQFPWSGVPGVLSPRAADPPRDPSGMSMEPIINPNDPNPSSSSVRGLPPPANIVVAKNAIDTALKQLSVDEVQLSAASAEINRRIEEAQENAELTRIAAAGLASPQVLEQLVASSTLRREQQRQKDELKVLQAWEKDQLNSASRDNNLAYMQRLFAIATGDDEVVAEMENTDRVIVNPSELRKSVDLRKKSAIETISQEKLASRLHPAQAITLDVQKGSNWPSSVEIFIRARIFDNQTLLKEAQTNSVTDPSSGGWNEQLYFEFPSRTNIFVELCAYQYNSLGRDILLAQTRVPLSSLRDSDKQVGVWLLEPVDELMNGIHGTVGMRVEIFGESNAYSRIVGDDKGPLSMYRTDLQSSVNLMREKNMDHVYDQIEKVDRERMRLHEKLGEFGFAGNDATTAADGIVNTVVGHNDDESYTPVQLPHNPEDIPNEYEYDAPAWGRGEGGGTNRRAGGLRQVEKPFPSFLSLFEELVVCRNEGRLATTEGRQLSYDYSYVGQSKSDYKTDKKLPEYLSLLSDVLVEYKSDAPIIMAGIGMMCVMHTASSVDNRARIAFVLWEVCSRSIQLFGVSDKLVSDQVLTGLAVAVSNSTKVSESHLDFVLLKFAKAREPIQFEQMLQIIAIGAHSGYRRSDLLQVVFHALEKFRFNRETVQRALIAMAVLYGGSSRDPFPTDGSDIELVAVASGMYADIVGIQVAAIDVLRAIVSVSESHAERIENMIAPVIFDQSFERNQSNELVRLSLARLVLRLADVRTGGKMYLPEALAVLMRIIVVTSTAPAVGDTTIPSKPGPVRRPSTDVPVKSPTSDPRSIETVIVSLAAIRNTFTASRKDLVLALSESVSSEWISALEPFVEADATTARESCTTIEVLVQSTDLKESLVRAE